MPTSTYSIILAIIAIIFAILFAIFYPDFGNLISFKTRVGERKTVPRESYEISLSELWGEDTLDRLQDYVNMGEITDAMIRSMAPKMGVLRIYQENHHKVDLVNTFSFMLESWYNEKLFNSERCAACSHLMSVLRDSGCSQKVLTKIQRLCDSNISL